MEEGLPWMAQDTAVDVICVALPRQPARKEEEQYARPADAAAVEAALKLVVQVTLRWAFDIS